MVRESQTALDSECFALSIDKKLCEERELGHPVAVLEGFPRTIASALPMQTITGLPHVEHSVVAAAGGIENRELWKHCACLATSSCCTLRQRTGARKADVSPSAILHS